MNTAEQAYDDFIANIDTSVAGSDQYGDLRWHVACSAEANAGDMQAEGSAEATDTGFYEAALSTARSCVDCWQDYYPQLRKAA